MQNDSDNLPLIVPAADRKLSKLQSNFNAKINLINELKERIKTIEQQTIEINQRLEKELYPLEKQRIDARMVFVSALVDTFHNIKMSNKDKETLVDFLLSEVLELIQNHGKTELIEVYNQFNPTDYHTEMKQIQESTLRQAFNMFESMTGEKLSDYDLGPDAEEMDFAERVARLKAAYLEKMQQEEEEKSEKKNQKKKSAQQQAKAQKKEAEADLLTKSTRTIYLELAKELHPDRELNEQKRLWKTEMMQRISAAYNDNDLYELLSIRLEYKQKMIDSDSVDEGQLGLYIKILNEQIRNLREQYNGFFDPSNPHTSRLQQFGLGKAKQGVSRSINKEKKEIQAAITSMQYTQTHVLTDPKTFKQYIKTRRQQMENDGSFESFFTMVMGDKM